MRNVSQSISRSEVGATPDYGATTTPGGATFVYGGNPVSANVINGMRCVTNTRLLVPLQSQHSHIATTAQGMYGYDITQTQAQGGFDANDSPEPSPTVKPTQFPALFNSSYAATYNRKPKEAQ